MSALLARRYYRRAERELLAGDVDAAADSFRAANELVPSFVSARIGHAVVLARLGDPPRAAQVLRAGIARRPRSAGVRGALWRTLGDVLTKGGDYLGALDAYDEALAAHAAPVPGGGEAAERLQAGIEASILGGKVRALAKLGRYREAVDLLAVAARRSAAAGAA